MRKMVGAALNVLPWGLRKHVKHIPGAASIQRKLVSAAFDGKEFVHEVTAGPAKGVKFLIAMPEDKGIWTGTYEADFAAAVAASVKPEMVAYDVGGWHGFFAGIMAARHARAVHIFEPLPANAARIEKLMELNPELPLSLHRCALGSEPAQSELMVMPETSMAKLVDSPFQEHEQGGARHTVNIESVDSLVSRGALPPPDIVKMDIEGYELLALQGARQVLKTNRPVLLAEIHSDELLRDCSDLLSEAGYSTEVIGSSASVDGTVFHIRSVPR